MSLEYAIRPFVPPQTLATKRIVPVVPSGPVADATISWGAVGTLPTPVAEDNEDDLEQVGYALEFCQDTYRERSRETETKTVSQVGKPENFMQLEEVKRITFGKLQDGNQIAGAFASRTTAFSSVAITDSATWGTIKKRENCRATYNLNNG